MFESPLYFTTPSTTCSYFFFFFNDTATTEIYTLSLHDALPISPPTPGTSPREAVTFRPWSRDRKSTRLNSSHRTISYAVFCLKKTTTKNNNYLLQKKINGPEGVHKVQETT